MFLENELIKRKRETQIPKHCRNFNEYYVISSSQFPRPAIPDKVTDLRIDSLTNQDIRFIIITTIDFQEKSLKSSIRLKHLKILGDIRVL
ncbi:hypothetical protein WICPIJ_005521 [Wickerhamomyces pijperi]|uniref:Uncharacterized protein n=1 Tax=Wickerhamomyces pijperi TaxID=599730 RepID=A0A9P8TLX3_WICPI|nr:hypothetical protein WICPIJ_005521 [Wickerhamomyces pijperi]